MLLKIESKLIEAAVEIYRDMLGNLGGEDNA